MDSGIRIAERIWIPCRLHRIFTEVSKNPVYCHGFLLSLPSLLSFHGRFSSVFARFLLGFYRKSFRFGFEMTFFTISGQIFGFLFALSVYFFGFVFGFIFTPISGTLFIATFIFTFVFTKGWGGGGVVYFDFRFGIGFLLRLLF